MSLLPSSNYPYYVLFGVLATSAVAAVVYTAWTQGEQDAIREESARDAEERREEVARDREAVIERFGIERADTFDPFRLGLMFRHDESEEWDEIPLDGA